MRMDGANQKNRQSRQDRQERQGQQVRQDREDRQDRQERRGQQDRQDRQERQGQQDREGWQIQTRQNHDADLLQALNAEWQHLDGMIPDEELDEAMFQMMVRSHQASMRAKMWRDLFIFWMLALFILMATTYLYVNSVYMIIIVQMIALAIGVPLLLRLRGKGDAAT